MRNVCSKIFCQNFDFVIYYYDISLFIACNKNVNLRLIRAKPLLSILKHVNLGLAQSFTNTKGVRLEGGSKCCMLNLKKAYVASCYGAGRHLWGGRAGKSLDKTFCYLPLKKG